MWASWKHVRKEIENPRKLTLVTRLRQWVMQKVMRSFLKAGLTSYGMKRSGKSFDKENFFQDLSSMLTQLDIRRLYVDIGRALKISNMMSSPTPSISECSYFGFRSFLKIRCLWNFIGSLNAHAKLTKTPTKALLA